MSARAVSFEDSCHCHRGEAITTLLRQRERRQGSSSSSSVRCIRRKPQRKKVATRREEKRKGEKGKRRLGCSICIPRRGNQLVSVPLLIKFASEFFFSSLLLFLSSASSFFHNGMLTRNTNRSSGRGALGQLATSLA